MTSYFILHMYFSEEIRLGISCGSSAKQMIHMKCQALFSQKNMKKKIKMLAATVVISTLMIMTKYFYFPI